MTNQSQHQDGILPKDWKEILLGDFGYFKTSSVDKKSNAGESSIKLLNYMDVYRHNFIDSSINFMKVTAKKHQILNNDVRIGDILFTPSSETPDDIGHSAVVTEYLKNTLYSYHLVRYRINEKFELDLRYRGYFCNFHTIFSQFLKLATGSTRYTLAKDDFKRTSVIIPEPLPEQQKIAEILTAVDEAIEKTDQLIKKHERIKQGVMQVLLTKGIDEDCNIRSEETHEFKDSELGLIPVEWVVKTLNKSCEKIQDGTHFSPKINSDGKFKYITSKNIRFGYLDLTDLVYLDEIEHKKIYRSSSVKYGDLLLTKDGANTGNLTINTIKEEISLLSSVAFLRGIKSLLNNVFLFYYLSSTMSQKKFKDQMSGNAITRITLEKINDTLISLPEEKEQEIIVERLKSIDQKIEKEEAYKQKLLSIKNGLMEDLLTGKVRTNQLLNI